MHAVMVVGALVRTAGVAGTTSRLGGLPSRMSLPLPTRNLIYTADIPFLFQYRKQGIVLYHIGILSIRVV